MDLEDESLENGFQLFDISIYSKRNVIQRGSNVRRIEPKAMQVLMLLVTKPGIVFSRQEILDQVWPNSFSGDDALARCISLLRSALGENKDSRKFIETIPKTGYRLIAPVVYNKEKQVIKTNGQYDTTQVVSKKWILALTTAFLIIAGYYFNNTVPGTTVPHIDDTASTNIYKPEIKDLSIAVLPFANLSADPEQEYFGDGIAEEILNVLAKIQGLQVTSRSSSFAFKESKINISEVATKLGVRHILEGSVRKSGNRIRISAQLIDAKTDLHLWSETYEHELDNIFTIQDEVSAAIASALKLNLNLQAKSAARKIANINPSAQVEYLKGRFFIERRTPLDTQKALTHFSRAVELSPDYASAWMGIAWAWLFRAEKYFGDVAIEVAKINARTAAEKSLVFDPDLAEAHAIMGLLEKESYKVDSRDKVIFHLEKALLLNPNFADAYMWLAVEQQAPDKRFELMSKAVQLDPMSIIISRGYAADLITYGRLTDAENTALHIMDIDASSSYCYEILADIRLIQGRYAEAAILQEKIIQLTPGVNKNILEAGNLFFDLGLIVDATRVVNETPYQAFGYLYNNNKELFLNKIREQYPRSEQDIFGAEIRGSAEAIMGNYSDALKYQQLADPSFWLPDIYNMLQAGDIKIAADYLMHIKIITDNLKKEGVKYLYGYESLENVALQIAYLEADIDKAIEYLQNIIQQGHIIQADYKIYSMYADLRAHPQWPLLLKESDKRAKEQRDLYQNLMLASQ